MNLLRGKLPVKNSQTHVFKTIFKKNNKKKLWCHIKFYLRETNQLMPQVITELIKSIANICANLTIIQSIKKNLVLIYFCYVVVKPMAFLKSYLTLSSG